MLDLTELVRRGRRSATSRRCRRCGARRWCRSSTRTPPAPGSRSRPRPSGSRADTMTFSVSHVVGEEGREPARHRADDRGDGHRRDRRAPLGRGRAAPGRRRGLDASVINAGDGRHEHPTQALLDAFTLRRHRGPSLDGCRVAIVGDIRNSRVARSDVKALHALGCERHARRPAHAACPSGSTAGRSRSATTSTTCSPTSTSSTSCASSASASARRCSRSLREYAARWGSPRERAARLKPDTLVMHPGPMNRGRRDRGRGRRLGPRRSSPSRSPTASRCAWPCCGRCSDREDPLSEVADHGWARASTTTGERVADVRVRRRRDRRGRRRPRAVGGRDRARRRGLRRRARARRHPGALPRAGPTRKPRRSRPARAPPRSAGAPRWSCMPNTDPPLDDAAVVQSVLDRGARPGCATCVSRAASPRAARGEELAPMGELYDLGVRVFTDDGDCVADARRDARARSSTRRRCPARCSRSTPKTRARRAAGTCTKARGRRGSASRAGPRRRSRRSSPATSQLARAHRRPRTTCCTCRARQPSSSCAPRRPTGVRVTAECTPQHLVLTDECVRALRPGVQDEPAAARAGRRRRASAPASLDGTIDAIATDHAPHTPETQGAPVRGGAARHARRRDRARRRAHRRWSSRASSRSPTRSARCRGSPARVAGLDADGHGGPIAAGRAANLCVIDPAARVGRSTPTRLASRVAQLALGRLEAHRQGPPHRPRTASPDRAVDGAARHERVHDPSVSDVTRRAAGAGRRRRRSRARRRAPARRRGRRPARSCSTPRSSGYQEIVTDPSYAGQIITFTYPHIGNYGVNGDDDESRAPVLPRRDRARPRAPRRQNWRATDDLDGFLERHGVAGHRRDRHPPAHPSHPRRRARCPGAFGTDEAAVRCSRPRRPTAAPTASTSSPTVTTDRAVHRRPRRRDRSTSSRTTSASSASILDQLVARGCQVEVVPASHDRRPTCSPASPTACSSRTVPAIPPRSTGAARQRARTARRGAGVRHLPRAPDHRPRARRATPSSCAFGHHGGNHPVRHVATGRVEITSQNHNYAVDADSLAAAASSSRT